ncbi:Putative aromatic amino acid beta-eliminating lyase/threonine aldolase [Colletotrichum destructivum]|uniref:Aromatic amino acid beta-eliminating lyase/threonine aldolase n=1 Tax=Colletotrichum destructivum TaxID=34406 RepID=A0AAX4IBB6_9PEZI|nr:Putative aromatic amino acid beta-eliminating lyase/threonine aldolase [Colletotrichum destructivum]
MPSQFPAPEAAPRYSFLDDYSEGAHPALLKALLASNTSQEAGYGGDAYSALARQRIRRQLGRDNVGVFFVPSGTSANAISIAACLRPHEAVIAASSGHIVTREAGAIEAGGHKIINVPAPLDGKLTPQTVQRAVDDNWHFPHVAKPRLVYISNATEIGTLYTRAELAALKRVCERNGLLLFLDGARIGAALASRANDMTLRDVLDLTDVFWIGGTKNGALLGEAVVVKDPQLATEFEFHVKQHGALLAKSRVMGTQFAELFRGRDDDDDGCGGIGGDVNGNGNDDCAAEADGNVLYFDLARRANLRAEALSAGITAAGFALCAATQTNQVFAVLPLPLVEALQAHFVFYVWERRGDGEAVVRLLTTWATDEAEVDSFIRMVKEGNNQRPLPIGHQL